MRHRALLVAVIVVLGGCGIGSPARLVRTVDVPATSLLTAPTVVVGAWRTAEQIVLGYESGAENRATDVWTLDVDSRSIEQLVIPDVGPCTQRLLETMHGLAGERLVVVQTCFVPDPAGTGVNLFSQSVLIVDSSTSEARSLGTVVERNFGRLSVRTDLARTIVSAGSRICESIADLTSDDLVPIDLVVRDGNRSFNLTDQVLDQGSDCSGHGIATAPDWSPDGSTLAFLASVDAIGRDGASRLDARMGLYLWTDETTVEPSLAGLRDVGQISWSPDGRFIAFGGNIDNAGRGTWLFEVATGDLTRVSLAEAITLAWAPNGRSLAITHSLNNDQQELLSLDLAGTVEE